MTQRWLALLALTAGVLPAAWPITAGAALGDNEQSVQADGVRMQARAAARVTAQAGYTVHELTVVGDTVVREYVAPSGVVFAVTWQGPFKPDLQQLLGAHFTTYAKSSNRVGNARSHVVVSEPGLIVETAGHMRAFRGRAWLPGAVPAGVALDTLQ
jgi:hypothetical protein